MIDQSKMENKRSPKRLSSEMICLKVESLYELSCMEAPVQLMEGNTESAVWHFKTNKGSWIVKIFEGSKRPYEWVVDEAHLYAYLNQHGIHAPKVLRSKRCQLSEEIEVDMHKYPIIVMELEELRFTLPSSVQDDELAKIAVTIARMHQCLQHYEGSLGNAGFTNSTAGRVLASLMTSVRGAIRICRGFESGSCGENFMVGWSPAGYDMLVSSPNASALTSKELARFLALDQEIKAFLTANSRSHHLTKSIIHRDLRLEHTPFLANGDVYIFDFTNRGFGAISEDLSGMLYELYTSDEITCDRWDKLKDVFLAGYTCTLHLTAIDLKAIPLFIMNFILWRISRISKRSKDMQRIVQIETIRQHYQFADHMLKSA